MQTFGGFAFAREYDIERKWREARLYLTEPMSTNLVLASLGVACFRVTKILLT